MHGSDGDLGGSTISTGAVRSRTSVILVLAVVLVAGAWVGPVRGPRGVLLAGPPLSEVPPVPAAALDGEAAWGALSLCESTGDFRAIGGNGRFFGAFQFTLASWRWVGMRGNPIDHPYAVQLEAARRLYARQGWEAWPVCARRLGLIGGGVRSSPVRPPRR